MIKTIEIKCPGCGERLSIDMKSCPSCHGPVVISTFNSVYSMPMLEVNKYANEYKKALSSEPDNKDLNKSVGICYLKLKLYDKAICAFEKAIEDNFDDSEVYFYCAVSLLQGKKAFLQQRTTIDKVLEYLNAAIMIENKGIYYYFLAYIKYDFFARKFYNTVPSYTEVLNSAKSYGISDYDIKMFYEMLGVERPSSL